MIIQKWHTFYCAITKQSESKNELHCCSMAPLPVDWLEWNANCRLRQQELEDRHSQVEYELRRLMSIPGLHSALEIWFWCTLL